MSKAKKQIDAALYDIIRRPVVTEKSTEQSQYNKVTFLVRPETSKKEVKDAVENIFDVKVTAVNTIRMDGKTKRFRGKMGKRNAYKKAIVSLAEGNTIDVMASV